MSGPLEFYGAQTDVRLVHVFAEGGKSRRIANDPGRTPRENASWLASDALELKLGHTAVRPFHSVALISPRMVFWHHCRGRPALRILGRQSVTIPVIPTMSKTLSLAHLSIEPGQRTRGLVPVEVKGQTVQLPVFLINGIRPGPRLVVTAGIHGAEYPCVEAAIRLGRSIDPEALSGQLIIVPSANPVAFRARSIYVTPPDGLNLNRQFPGDPEGSFTQVWADWLFRNVITVGDMYIDMHGGDMIEALIPFVAITLTGNPAVNETAERMARAYGIRAFLAKEGVGPIGGTTTGSAAVSNVPALLTEAGGQGVWHESEVDILQDGVRRVMTEFDMYAGIDDPGEEAERLGGWDWLRADVDGLFYPSVAIGDQVERGQRVGEIKDIFGETLRTYDAPVGGEVLFLVTSLAMNAGDPLMSIAWK